MGSPQARWGVLIEVRRLESRDVEDATRVSAAAFEMDLSEPEAAARWRARVGHLLRTDPDGAFVALESGEVVGVAQAMMREGLWCLSLLTIDPNAQSRGAGGALLEATLDYGRDRRGAVIVSSADPRAMSLYARAGFAVRPTVEVFGETGLLPPPEPRVVRLTDPAELVALEPISRAVRGAAQTPELEFAMTVREARVLVLEDRGFAVAMDRMGAWLLTALDEVSARVLLVEALRAAGESDEPKVRWITEAQGWAVQTAVGLGLRLRGYGALFVQGELGPLRPFIPSPAFA